MVVFALDKVTRQWLLDCGLQPPHGPSRMPTVAEMEQVLQGLTGFTVEAAPLAEGKPWTVLLQRDGVAQEWLALRVPEVPSKGQPVQLFFDKGDVCLMQELLQKLTPVCGSLVLVSDADAEPMLIV